MKDIILKVENVSKQYRLGLVGTGTISHDLNRWWNRVRGKEDPYLKVGESNDRATKGTSDYVWALKDINFEVEKGEVLGIIGKNGAGKSTILKILSKVTGPTTGEIKTKGRIASLLEVGTGFHPEMTGRENIYLNGAILGMTKAEINSKIDEIIDFSGCQRYIDTPVKRYSSGMTVRLAFAVAAHLEPEILVIDEVLAVGDAEFQKKAVGKMQDISRGEGRTVLFVSHNMESIQKLCTRCIVLAKGSISFDGETSYAIEKYLNIYGNNSNDLNLPIEGQDIQIDNFKIYPNLSKITTSNLVLGGSYDFVLDISNFESKKRLNIRFQFIKKNEGVISTLNTYHKDFVLEINSKEQNSICCQIDKLTLTAGSYYLGIHLMDLFTKKVIYDNEYFFQFEIVNGDFYETGKLPARQNLGKVMIEHNWFIRA